MAWFNPPTLQARCVEGIGPTLVATSPHSGHPATYLETEEQSFAALRFAWRHVSLPCVQGRVGVGCCCFCALGARCFSRGPSATVRRGRGGRAAGEPTDGLAFSTGQEARPRLTHFPSMEGRKASPRGVVFSWLLLFWTSKREVVRAPAGARNRFVARDNAEARAPTPLPEGEGFTNQHLPEFESLGFVVQGESMRCLEPANWNIEYSGQQCAFADT